MFTENFPGTSSPSPEDPEDRIAENIREATPAAPFEGELESSKDAQDQLVVTFLHNDLERAQFEHEYASFVIEGGVVSCETIDDLKQTLIVFGFDDEAVTEISTHEEAYLNKVQIQGLKGDYQIQLFKSTDGDIRLHPGLKVSWDDSISDEDLKKGLGSIVSTPDDLNSNDQDQIEE